MTKLRRSVHLSLIADRLAAILLHLVHSLRPGANLRSLRFSRCGHEEAKATSLRATFQSVRHEDDDYHDEKNTCDKESRMRFSFFHNWFPHDKSNNLSRAAGGGQARRA